MEATGSSSAPSGSFSRNPGQNTTIEPPRPDKYIPMRALNKNPGPGTDKKEMFERVLKRLLGFSARYAGDIGSSRNRGAEVPDDQNTAVWLARIPPPCTVADVLGAVARVGRVGKVYATVMAKPDPARRLHHAACKLVFFTRKGAENLIAAVQERRLVINGRVPLVQWNTIKSLGSTAELRSRVVIFKGPVAMANRQYLDKFFADRFQFDTEAVTVLEERDGSATLEWRFGSHRCQAEAAVMAVRRELDGKIQWKYAKDPCE